MRNVNNLDELNIIVCTGNALMGLLRWVIESLRVAGTERNVRVRLPHGAVTVVSIQI
jgi:hypothetical protein